MDYMPGLLPSEDELDRITKIYADLPLRNPERHHRHQHPPGEREMAKIPTLSLVFLPLSSLICSRS